MTNNKRNYNEPKRGSKNASKRDSDRRTKDESKRGSDGRTKDEPKRGSDGRTKNESKRDSDRRTKDEPKRGSDARTKNESKRDSKYEPKRGSGNRVKNDQKRDSRPKRNQDRNFERSDYSKRESYSREEGNEESFSNEMIYGRNPVMEALESGIEIEKILIQKNIEGAGKKVYAMAKKAGIPVQSLEKMLLDRTAQSRAHQGVIAFISPFDYCSTDEIISIAEGKEEKPFIVICDGIEDPHNLGAIIRSAEGAGVHGIIIPKRNSAGMNGTVIKTSSGAALHMAIARVSNIASEIESLQKKGFWIYGLDMDGQNYKEIDYDAPIALVVGSEGEGIARLVKEKCDFILSIPMRGKTSSLNASNAAAIAMYEISSQVY